MIRIRCIAIIVCTLLLAACQKDSGVSKIPHISLLAFAPDSAMTVNVDTCFFYFSLVDGDADIGDDSVSQIYLQDSRFTDLGFIKTPFPEIDIAIEDAKKGIEGKCLFIPFPQPTPRTDSLHAATGRDTLTYELYMKDRAGNESNHIVTHSFVIKT